MVGYPVIKLAGTQLIKAVFMVTDTTFTSDIEVVWIYWWTVNRIFVKRPIFWAVITLDKQSVGYVSSYLKLKTDSQRLV